MPSYTKTSPDAEPVLVHATIRPCAVPRSAVAAEQAMLSKRQAKAAAEVAETATADPVEPEPATKTETPKVEALTSSKSTK